LFRQNICFDMAEASQHLCFCLGCGRDGLTLLSDFCAGFEEKAPPDGGSTGELFGVSLVKSCFRCTESQTYNLTLEDAKRRIRIAYYLSDFLAAAGYCFQEDRDFGEWYLVLNTEYSPKANVDNIVMDSDKVLKEVGDDIEARHEDVTERVRRVSWHWTQCVKKMFCVERLLGDGSASGVVDNGGDCVVEPVE